MTVNLGTIEEIRYFRGDANAPVFQPAASGVEIEITLQDLLTNYFEPFQINLKKDGAWENSTLDGSDGIRLLTSDDKFEFLEITVMPIGYDTFEGAESITSTKVQILEHEVPAYQETAVGEKQTFGVIGSGRVLTDIKIKLAAGAGAMVAAHFIGK